MNTSHFLFKTFPYICKKLYNNVYLGDVVFYIYNMEKRQKICGVYKITNTLTKKYYIGSAVDLNNRFKCHKQLLKNNKHYNSHLQSSYNKYGKENFIYEIIETNDNKENIIEREQYWIDFLEANNTKKGYNKRITALSNLGIKSSEKTKEKLRLSHLGHKQSDETKIKISESQYKKICQFDKNGNHINTFNSFKEASEKTNILRPCISMVINNKIKSTGGFYWCLLENLNEFKIPIYKVNKTNKIKITCLQSNEIYNFDSILEASNKLNISKTILYTKNKNKKYKWEKI